MRIFFVKRDCLPYQTHKKFQATLPRFNVSMLKKRSLKQRVVLEIFSYSLVIHRLFIGYS